VLGLTDLSRDLLYHSSGGSGQLQNVSIPYIGKPDQMSKLQMIIPRFSLPFEILIEGDVYSFSSIQSDIVISSGDIFFEQGKTKDKICREMGIDLIIEDNGEHSLNYAKNGIRVLLLDKPWNKGISHENIYRCLNWSDILEKVEDLKNV